MLTKKKECFKEQIVSKYIDYQHLANIINKELPPKDERRKKEILTQAPAGIGKSVASLLHTPKIAEELNLVFFFVVPFKAQINQIKSDLSNSSHILNKVSDSVGVPKRGKVDIDSMKNKRVIVSTYDKYGSFGYLIRKMKALRGSDLRIVLIIDEAHLTVTEQDYRPQGVSNVVNDLNADLKIFLSATSIRFENSTPIYKIKRRENPKIDVKLRLNDNENSPSLNAFQIVENLYKKGERFFHIRIQSKKELQILERLLIDRLRVNSKNIVLLFGNVDARENKEMKEFLSTGGENFSTLFLLSTSIGDQAINLTPKIKRAISIYHPVENDKQKKTSPLIPYQLGQRWRNAKEIVCYSIINHSYFSTSKENLSLSDLRSHQLAMAMIEKENRQKIKDSLGIEEIKNLADDAEALGENISLSKAYNVGIVSSGKLVKERKDPVSRVKKIIANNAEINHRAYNDYCDKSITIQSYSEIVSQYSDNINVFIDPIVFDSEVTHQDIKAIGAKITAQENVLRVGMIKGFIEDRERFEVALMDKARNTKNPTFRGKIETYFGKPSGYFNTESESELNCSYTEAITEDDILKNFINIHSLINCEESTLSVIQKHAIKASSKNVFNEEINHLIKGFKTARAFHLVNTQDSELIVRKNEMSKLSVHTQIDVREILIIENVKNKIEQYVKRQIKAQENEVLDKISTLKKEYNKERNKTKKQNIKRKIATQEKRANHLFNNRTFTSQRELKSTLEDELNNEYRNRLDFSDAVKILNTILPLLFIEKTECKQKRSSAKGRARQQLIRDSSRSISEYLTEFFELGQDKIKELLKGIEESFREQLSKEIEQLQKKAVENREDEIKYSKSESYQTSRKTKKSEKQQERELVESFISDTSKHYSDEPPF